jgi:hypothetical protein
MPRRRLHIGKGYIDNVLPEVWGYEVSGMNVLRQWFSYRKRDRTLPIIERGLLRFKKHQAASWTNPRGRAYRSREAGGGSAFASVQHPNE